MRGIQGARSWGLGCIRPHLLKGYASMTLLLLSPKHWKGCIQQLWYKSMCMQERQEQEESSCFNRVCVCVFHCVGFFTEMYSGLSVGGAVEQEAKKQDQCPLWQTLSPDFVAEKQFNAGMATLEPHCAVCMMFCPYSQVTPHYFTGKKCAGPSYTIHFTRAQNNKTSTRHN